MPGNKRPAVFGLLELPILLTVILCLSSCNGDSVKALEKNVVGSWEEVRNTGETLQFDADGTMVMDSRSEHHDCVYDFPDPRHIRFNCATEGAPPAYQTWNVSVNSDKLVISDASEVGTYKRM
jgi:hypothetical protein